MASYVVLEPPGRGGEERAVLVRDGFHFLAFLLPLVWLLFNRLWIEALAVFAAGALIGALGTWFGAAAAASVVSVLLALFVGLEAASLKIAALRRRGWREWGVVEADNARDAEIRYAASLETQLADEFVPAEDIAQPQLPASRPATHPARPTGPVLGMLGYPGRN